MLFLRFKRELPTANVTAKPWSRDFCGLRLAVSHEKPDAKGPYCTSIPRRVYLIITEHVCVTVAPLTVELDLYVESFANIAEANMVSHVISIFGYEFTFLVM